MLHPDVTCIGPDGKFGYKADDLALHADGDIRITSVDREPVVAHVTGSVGVTHIRCRMTGVLKGEPFANVMVYTRACCHSDNGWQVVAAHVMIVGPAQ